VAVIDIGSNSGRVVVYQRDAAGQLRILATTRAALRLVRDVDGERRLGDEAIERTLEALRDFRAIARGAGARRFAAVATAALRDAANGEQLIRRVRRELGIPLRVIDGAWEARLGFVGAVHGLPVEDGMLFDLGGGSMQVTRFHGRRLVREWSLPLGALRLSHRFLRSDPPRRDELRQLREHVRRKLARAGIPPLLRGEELVGTGGTVRNLAKLDRRGRPYPIARLHGYVLEREAVARAVTALARRRLTQREKVAGLSDERADSIVGGGLAIEELMGCLHAPRVRVSGQGVREGLAYSLLHAQLPPAEEVRARSIASLAARFDTWDPRKAGRRRAVAAALATALDPREPEEILEALDHAANLIDIGRALDFFDRHAHVAELVVATDLDGFSHRQIALIAAVTRAARDDVGGREWSPLLDRVDRERVRRAGVLLALADDIEERCPRGGAVKVGCRVGRRNVTVRVPRLLAWRPRTLAPRFERVFGRRLVVEAGAGRRGA
jgi:exopolyphosphatase/guanosine-5'-triphosphate,3'-diphosphate pyrophosphatase